MDRGWQFCPGCGAANVDLDQLMDSDIFSNVFNQLMRQMDEDPEFMKRVEEMSKHLEKRMEMFDIKPAFQGKPEVRSSGFRINIQAEPGKKPKVDVKTFGTNPPQIIDAAKGRPLGGLLGTPMKASKPGKLSLEKATEPTATAKRVQRGVEIEVDLPGAKESDIEVNDLQSSVEVKASAGEVGFFKIIRKPETTRVVGYSFSKGKLKLLIA